MTAFLTSILSNVGTQLVEWLWSKLEAKLQEYFEAKSKISAISNEASALSEELKNATTDAERFQILRKIGSFQDRLGN